MPEIDMLFVLENFPIMSKVLGCMSNIKKWAKFINRSPEIFWDPLGKSIQHVTKLLGFYFIHLHSFSLSLNSQRLQRRFQSL